MSKTNLIMAAIAKVSDRDKVKMYDVTIKLKDGSYIKTKNNRITNIKRTKKTPQERVLTVCRRLIWNRQSERLDSVPGKDERLDRDLSEKNIKEIKITPTITDI